MKRLLVIGVTGMLLAAGCATLTEVSQTSGPNTAGSSYRKAAFSGPEMSGDGRYSVFVGPRSGSDTTSEVYRRDSLSGTTVRVSSDVAGAAVGGDTAAMSRDGRFVAFRTTAALVAADTNRDVANFKSGFDVYVRDMNAAASYDLVTYDEHGVQLVPEGPNGLDNAIFLSSSGRYVAFQFKLSFGRTFGGSVYVRDRQSLTTTVVGGGYAQLAGLSGDGLHVGIDDYTACVGQCPEYAGGHVSDWKAGTTVDLGCESGGLLAMSDDGRYLATWQSGRLAGCVFGVARYDRLRLGPATMVTPSLPANELASGSVAMSADGNRVGFDVGAPLVPTDTNAVSDVYVRDVGGRDLSLASQTALNQAADGLSFLSDISADGTAVQFETDATNLLANDTDGKTDTVVTPALRPTVDGVLPASVARGQTVTFVYGSGSGFAPGLTVSFGSGVTVTDLVVVDTHTFSVTLRVAAGTTRGPRDVMVAQAGVGGTARGWCFGCFTVT